ncbi:hypothetical protein ABIB26_002415 [Arthrobacter sp. UYEF20]
MGPTALSLARSPGSHHESGAAIWPKQLSRTLAAAQ